MSTIQIEPAVREGSPIIIGLASQSGEGKTFTALLLAYGLAGRDPTRIGILDTENKRARLYADIFKQEFNDDRQFNWAGLYPPFTPDRYCEAIKEFQQAGVSVLVIDSVTHEWEGEGGCHDYAWRKKANNQDRKVADWSGAKKKHKRFVNVMLQSNMHIVACVRAREKTKMNTVDGDVVYTECGLQPIQEKGFIYEMTSSVMLSNQGCAQDIIKVPRDLMPIMGRGDGPLKVEDGEKLIQWLNGAPKKLDPKIEGHKNFLVSSAASGMKTLEDAWSALDAKTKKAVGGQPFLDTLKESAAAFEASQPGKPSDEAPAQSRLQERLGE